MDYKVNVFSSNFSCAHNFYVSLIKIPSNSQNFPKKITVFSRP